MKVIGEGVIVHSSSTIRETYDEKIYYSVSGSNALKEDADKRYIKVNGKEHKLYFAIKRIMDIILSFLGLIILSPIFLITAIAIRLESKGKVIFSQTRTGKDGKEFKMYKFRSMCEDAEKLRSSLLDQNKMDGPVFKIVEDPRVTKVGHFIRKTSIDELPQLINILKGDMILEQVLRTIIGNSD